MSARSPLLGLRRFTSAITLEPGGPEVRHRVARGRRVGERGPQVGDAGARPRGGRGRSARRRRCRRARTWVLRRWSGRSAQASHPGGGRRVAGRAARRRAGVSGPDSLRPIFAITANTTSDATPIAQPTQNSGHADRVQHQRHAADHEAEQRDRDRGPGRGGVAVVVRHACSSGQVRRAGCCGHSLFSEAHSVGSRPSSIAFHRSRFERSSGGASAVSARGARRVVPAAHLGPVRHPADRERRRDQESTAPTAASPVPGRQSRVDARSPVTPVGSASGAGRGADERQPADDHATSAERRRGARGRPRRGGPAAGHQHDAPAGQHHQAERGRQRHLAGVAATGSAGSRTCVRRVARRLEPGPVAGHRGQRARREAEQHDRAERPAAAQASATVERAGRRRRSRCGRRCGRPRPPGRP